MRLQVDLNLINISLELEKHGITKYIIFLSQLFINNINVQILAEFINYVLINIVAKKISYVRRYFKFLYNSID